MLAYIIKTLTTGLVGTSVMTVSSALMSIKGQDFREPKHLSRLTGRLLPILPKEAETAAGWTAHYAMGMTFAAIYVSLWERKILNPSFASSVLLGLASSLIGVGIWKATFKVHPFTPLMNYKRFYLQRIPAHVFFAVFATIGYVLAKKYINDRKAKTGVIQDQQIAIS